MNDVGTFLRRHLRRRLEQRGVDLPAAEVERLVSFEAVPMPGDAGPARVADPNSQSLARHEVSFRHGDIVVGLNAHDGSPLSWTFAKLAEGDGPPPSDDEALALAIEAGQPPEGAVLVHSAYEDMAGRPVFVAQWAHHHDQILVERDFIRVLVSGTSGRVFAVHRRWHAVDTAATER
jgi:hypothetical protein